MTPPLKARTREHTGQWRGGSNQPNGEGRTTTGTNYQSRIRERSDISQRRKGRRLMGWQEIKAFTPCDTPAKPNDVSYPNPPKVGAWRNYDDPPVRRG